MLQMWLGKYRSVTPASFKKCMNSVKPLFAGHEQQDAQEFLVELLDAIHEDLNVAEESPARAGESVVGLEDEAATKLTTSVSPYCMQSMQS